LFYNYGVSDNGVTKRRYLKKAEVFAKRREIENGRRSERLQEYISELESVLMELRDEL
jgi:hypothetical protein